jgi:hypothetical protein
MLQDTTALHGLHIYIYIVCAFKQITIDFHGDCATGWDKPAKQHLELEIFSGQIKSVTNIK